MVQLRLHIWFLAMQSEIPLRVDAAHSPLESSRLEATHTPTEAGRNPLSIRLFKVLGARYDDPETREALEILSGLYAPTFSSKGETRRTVNASLMSDDSDEEEQPSRSLLAAIPPLEKGRTFDDSAARARRNLRKDMEGKLAQSSKMFLAAFSEVNQVCVSHISLPQRNTEYYDLQRI